MGTVLLALERYYGILRSAIKDNETFFIEDEWMMIMDSFNGHLRTIEIEDGLHNNIIVTEVSEADKHDNVGVKWLVNLPE